MGSVTFFFFQILFIYYLFFFLKFEGVPNSVIEGIPNFVIEGVPNTEEIKKLKKIKKKFRIFFQVRVFLGTP